MTDCIDFNSKVPFHIQAEQIIRRMINSEVYQKGATLPKEVDLANQLGISRNTLRMAINRLVDEGLIIRKKRVGSVVNPLGKASSNARNWKSFSQEMKMLGIEVKNYDLHISWEYPDEDVMHFFGIQSKTRILRMSRVRGSLQAPIVYFYSYFNPKIGMTGEENFTIPLYTMLKEQYGISVGKSIEEVSAMLADEELSAKLDVKVGSPILQRKRRVLDENSTPVEYNVGFYRADSFTYRIEAD